MVYDNEYTNKADTCFNDASNGLRSNKLLGNSVKILIELSLKQKLSFTKIENQVVIKENQDRHNFIKQKKNKIL